MAIYLFAWNRLRGRFGDEHPRVQRLLHKFCTIFKKLQPEAPPDPRPATGAAGAKPACR